jgi:fatty acid-binding protein DegV
MDVNKSVFTFSQCTNKIKTFQKSRTYHKAVHALINKMQIPQTNRPDRGIQVCGIHYWMCNDKVTLMNQSRFKIIFFAC